MGDGTIQGQGANIEPTTGYHEASVTIKTTKQVYTSETDTLGKYQDKGKNFGGAEATRNPNNVYSNAAVDTENPELAAPGSSNARGHDGAEAKAATGGFNPYFSGASALIAAELMSVMHEITDLLNESTEVSTRQNIETTNASIDATKSAAQHTIEKGELQKEQAIIQGFTSILAGTAQVGGGAAAVALPKSADVTTTLGSGISKVIEGAGGVIAADYSLDIAQEDAAGQMQNLRADLYKQGARGIQDGQQSMVQSLQAMIDSLTQAARGTISPFKQI